MTQPDDTRTVGYLSNFLDWILRTFDGYGEYSACGKLPSIADASNRNTQNDRIFVFYHEIDIPYPESLKVRDLAAEKLYYRHCNRMGISHCPP